MGVGTAVAKTLTKSSDIAGGQVNVTRVTELTPSENKFFSTVMENEPDRIELLEQVPSAKLKEGKLEVLDSDLPALDKYVDETVILEVGRRQQLPPSFNRRSFVEKIQKEGVGSAAVSSERGKKIKEKLLRLKQKKSSGKGSR